MLYNFAIEAYRAGVAVAALTGHRKAALLDRGLRECHRSLLGAFRPGDKVVWVHAASLGEFEQGRPLMEMIRRQLPDRKILLTFFSPSGYEVRKDWQGADMVCYLPFDTPARVRRFLDAVNPEMAIFVKYEIWRNYLRELHRRHIPVYLISAAFRPDHKFFKPVFGWYADWLRLFTHIFVQDELSSRLLAGIGIHGVTVAGDTRFDRVADIRRLRKPIPALSQFAIDNSGESRLMGGALVPERPTGQSTGKNNSQSPFPNSQLEPILMAGSSWPADEDIYIPWILEHPEVKLVIAPHEFDARRLEALRARFAPGEAILLSELQNQLEVNPGMRSLAAAGGSPAPRVLIIDCFGLLSSAYAYADIAYVGGGFGAGIHNINEPAVYDIPVIYGPNNARFVEAAEMAAAGGGFPIASAADFAAVMTRLLAERAASSGPAAPAEAAQDAPCKAPTPSGKKAGDYIRSRLGATARIFPLLGIRS